MLKVNPRENGSTNFLYNEERSEFSWRQASELFYVTIYKYLKHIIRLKLGDVVL
jgi:hypothetical protein